MAPRESDGSYQAVFDLNPQPMWICDLEGRRFLAVNDAALGLYGYARQEFLDTPVRQVVLPGAPGEPEGETRHVGKGEKLLQLRTVPREVSFQGTPALLTLLYPAPREGAAPEARIAELERHLTECQTRLEASNKELETFSYSVSHDLRAPLRHIDGFSKALIDDYGDRLDEEGKEYLSRIGQATKKMGQLIDDVLKLARVTRAELELQTVNLSVIAQVIALELKHTDPERRVDFRIEKGVSAHGDQRLLRLLMENLMGNAWKFTGKKEEAVVEFGTRKLEGETAYYVRDNGAGFDMAYVGKLFSLFQRLHRADEFEGSGVGLAVAQRIVHRHGGRIWGESSPGFGATFYFTLAG